MRRKWTTFTIKYGAHSVIGSVNGEYSWGERSHNSCVAFECPGCLMGCEVFNPWVYVFYGYDFSLQVWALCSHLGHVHTLVSHQNDEILKRGLALARKTPWTQSVFLSKRRLSSDFSLYTPAWQRYFSLARSLRTSNKWKYETEKFRWKRSTV